MAVGVDIIKTSGRLIFDLVRGEDKTTRTLEIVYPITNTTTVQEAINVAETVFTNAEGEMNTLIQPSNWRDANITEDEWTTTGVRYEIVQTVTTPITPEEITP